MLIAVLYKPLMDASFNAFNSSNYYIILAPPKFSFSVRFFSAESSSGDDNNEDDSDDVHDKNSNQLHLRDDHFVKDVNTILDIINE
ncbi:hypothetical protein MtrunA17_Chr4g0029451 [Medicago truncatula]|uniref:Uncharacterized protein n=2 Tax=Medicago truncatula TaxID=3880 RepID=A0A396I588_MEDTR|nr:hypothetical protein MtrunA17_Chr4g0029451 [Medicago truncatula]